MAARNSTPYESALTTQSARRRCRGHADVGSIIACREAQGKGRREHAGWSSEGMAAAPAHELRKK